MAESNSLIASLELGNFWGTAVDLRS